jgi:hypothetical protein
MASASVLSHTRIFIPASFGDYNISQGTKKQVSPAAYPCIPVNVLEKINTNGLYQCQFGLSTVSMKLSILLPKICKRIVKFGTHGYNPPNQNPKER